MAKNFKQPGDVVTVTAPAAVSSGDVVVVNELVGVAMHDAGNGAPVEIAIEGIFTLPADNNLVINQGDRVFWDAANGWVDKTIAAQLCVGRAVTAKLLAGTTVDVKLGPAVPAAV